MIIDKIASKEGYLKKYEYYYNSAREGMFDLINSMQKQGLVDTIFLPGYIGWSPKEGSGIFDPINKLDGISVQYYKMTSDLSINVDDLTDRIRNLKNDKFLVLNVNYFGFVDVNINQVTKIVRENNGWIIEDNAHGFFTYQYSADIDSDATFFSLHKMFPFQHGGSLIIKNKFLQNIEYNGKNMLDVNFYPWQYDIREIANRRKKNYSILETLIRGEEISEYFIPLKGHLLDGNIPQTFPIVIKKGNRDKIYELMNETGYGVVSLYHTLIEPLRKPEYQESLNLSKSIMNLPVHQDVVTDKYQEMVELLVKYCQLTSD